MFASFDVTLLTSSCLNIIRDRPTSEHRREAALRLRFGKQR
jgi:hypothetical protein